MKTDIHPTYHSQVKIACSCGNVIVAGSTQEKMATEMCSKCHPFYTGQQKLVDTAGRVDKFKERAAKFEEKKDELKKREEEKLEKRKAKEYKEKEVPAEVLRKALEETKQKEVALKEAERLAKKTTKKTTKKSEPKNKQFA